MPIATAKKIIVYRSLWKNRMYSVVQRAHKDWENYQQAREYAKAKGFSGIKVEYL